jgi:hypothetical protein
MNTTPNTYSVHITATATGETIPYSYRENLTKEQAEDLARSMGTGEGYRVHITEPEPTPDPDNLDDAGSAYDLAVQILDDVKELNHALTDGNDRATGYAVNVITSQALTLIRLMDQIRARRHG